MGWPWEIRGGPCSFPGAIRSDTGRQGHGRGVLSLTGAGGVSDRAARARSATHRRGSRSGSWAGPADTPARQQGPAGWGGWRSPAPAGGQRGDRRGDATPAGIGGHGARQGLPQGSAGSQGDQTGAIGGCPHKGGLPKLRTRGGIPPFPAANRRKAGGGFAGSPMAGARPCKTAGSFRRSGVRHG